MSELKALESDLLELERRQKEKRLSYYRPYSKQAEFHKAGARYRERLLMAGNQQGKTLAGAAEMAMHLTGDYPEDWEGRRFTKEIRAWAASITSETTRDNAQRLLLGEGRQYGTGMIPKERIHEVRMARTVADAVDTVYIRHKCGGLSSLSFKAYEKGREKWQGESLEVVWFDEEPAEDIYSEGLARISARQGMVWMTFTPLLGMSNVVSRFIQDKSPDRHVTQMTIDDAEHIPVEERQRIIDSYPIHEREARVKGVPMLGSGRVFPVPEESIKVEAFTIPSHWAEIGGLDFGWDHPTAGAKLAWDRDNDCVYVTNCYRVREATPVIHAAALKPWGKWLPWAWPHDGLQHDKGSGVQLAEQYKAQGLKMLSSKATFDDGSNGVEAGVMEMLERMQTGRLKVFSHLADWFEEFRMYHRKDGRIVKERDDLMSATRYALMMLRHATNERRTKDYLRPIQYAHRGIV